MEIISKPNENGSQIESVVTAHSLALAQAGRVVVEAAELAIAPGITSLIGPNGSGKSTLLHGIAGLLRPTAGKLRVFGVDPPSARRRVAYVLQGQHVPAQLPVTVREVVALGRAAALGPFRPLGRGDRAIVDGAIERVGLTRLARRHVGDLSGGERQRAFVAQGLAQQAALLLLDEPMAGLDVASSAQIRGVLNEECAAGRTVVVATHDLNEAMASDRVILLAGRVVAAGAPSEVLTGENLAVAYGGRLLDIGGGLLLVDDDAAHHHDDGHHPGAARHDVHRHLDEAVHLPN